MKASSNPRCHFTGTTESQERSIWSFES